MLIKQIISRVVARNGSKMDLRHCHLIISKNEEVIPRWEFNESVVEIKNCRATFI